MKNPIHIALITILLVVSCKQQVYFNISTSMQPSEGGSIIASPSSNTVLEGTTVSFEAVPKGDYVFTGWDGSLSGKENPKTVTVVSDILAIAKFGLPEYSLALSVEGKGVVYEEVISTKTEYTSGTVVELSATPADYWVFDHWEGDVSGQDNPKLVSISSPMNIKAVFYIRPIELPDLNQPSYSLSRLYPYVDLSQFGFSTYQRIPIDYNRDGYIDIITAQYEGIGSMTNRVPIGFYKGLPNGTFVPDDQNDKKIEGMLHIRKMIYGDYNKDGLPDICLLGHGFDGEPWPGEYPVILMSSGNGRYTDIRLSDIVSYYHGGASGDFDNDGDLDIFLCDNFGKPGILVNDGIGNFAFHQNLVNSSLFVSTFNAEIYDIDHDGYLDIICGGHDWEDQSYYEKGDKSYSNTPMVMWGNGISYNNDNYVRLPGTPIDGYGLTCDFRFRDLDGDGIEEIIIARTGDGVHSNVAFYAGWAIQVLKRNGRAFSDATFQFIEQDDSFFPYRQYTGWIVKTDFFEEGGESFLMGSFDCPDFPVPQKLYKVSTSGKFEKVFIAYE